MVPDVVQFYLAAEFLSDWIGPREIGLPPSLPRANLAKQPLPRLQCYALMEYIGRFEYWLPYASARQL